MGQQIWRRRQTLVMHAPPPSSPTTAAGADRPCSDLPQDLLAEIHGRLGFTGRLAFTLIFGDLFKPEAPCLVLPNDPTYWYRTTFFSLADRHAHTVRAAPLRDYDLLGSSAGWLAMADKEARMYLVNPVTGEQHVLPAITTMVGLDVTRFSDPCDDSINRICFDREEFMAIRFGGGPYPEKTWPNMVYAWSPGMRNDRVYRKVVLSPSARPSSYAAMLILAWKSYNIPAFATSEDPTWRVAAPRDDIVDAVHHRGRFYSLDRSGVVEAWDEKELTSQVVASTKPGESDDKRLATTPDGRLVVVLWDAVRSYGCRPGSSKYSFKVQVLDEASGSWQETDDIGQCAVLIGAANNIMCVSTRAHQNLKDNCVYFTNELKREVRMYSLQHRTLTKTIEVLNVYNHNLWKAAAWFTPSFR